MKTKKKQKKEKCRHRWGEMEYPSDDLPHQVCEKCGRTKFKGERYAYGSRTTRA